MDSKVLMLPTVTEETWVRSQRRSKMTSYHFMMLVVILSVVMAVLSSIALGVTLYYLPSPIKKEAMTPNTITSERPVCLPCAQLELDPSRVSVTLNDPLLKKLQRQSSTGPDDKCCARSNDELSAMLEMSFRGQVRHRDVPAENRRNEPICAHVSLTWKESKDKDRERRSYLNKRGYLEVKNSSQNTHVHGVDLDEGVVRIVHTGLYSVYSSAHFHLNNPAPHARERIWSHYVSRIAPNQPSRTNTLLATHHSLLETSGSESVTLSTSGIFYLERGDVISVHLRGGEFLISDEKCSFLGLFLLSQPTT